jgi:thiol-disulfide isomerase/thioredoxin
VNRRQMALGGVAVAAGVAGVGAAWWKSRAPDAARSLQPERGSATTTAEGGNAGDGAIEAFWKSSFDTPEGAPLAMSTLKGKPLLVNFWATWCPPCIEELPLLDGFHTANKDNSWQVLGLAVDQPSAVRKWLQAKPLGFPVGMAGFGGTELSKSFGNLSGGLPFSVVFSAAGQLLHRKTGKLTPEDLSLWAQLK